MAEKSMEYMAKEISSQATMFESCSESIIRQCRDIVARNSFKDKINRVYITGCGDSYFAGIACRDIFIKYAKLHTEVWRALEFSRYVCENEVDDRALVLSVSSSGSVARTAECSIRAAEKGALSVAVTSNPEGRLAKVSSEKVVVEVPSSLGFAPGTKSYCASMLALICIAAALGEDTGALTSDQADEIFDYIKRLGKVMTDTVEKNYDFIGKYINAYFDEENPHRIRMFHVLGSGPNNGTAQFGTMKLLEAAGFDSIPQEIEEWAHSQYFTTRAGTHTVVIAPRGVARDRALEVLQAVTVMDGKKIVIGEEDDIELARQADIYIPVVGKDIKEEFSPLVYAIPLELLAMSISEYRGVPAFDFEAKPWRKQENFRQIYHSEIVTFADEEKR